MDSIFGICGDDWVIVCADSNINRSIFCLKHNEDKIEQINQFKVMGTAGDQADTSKFSNLMCRNLQLEELRTGHEPGVEATANFLRSEIDQSFRQRGSGPYMVNCLLGGYDVHEKEAKLFWLDYIGTLQQVTKGAHGYAGYFVNSVLDNHYKSGMSLDEGIEACKKCVLELKTRFIMNQSGFVAKIVTKDGIQVMPLQI